MFVVKRGILNSSHVLKSQVIFVILKKCSGPNTFPMISSLVDDVLTVTDEQVASAWCDVMQRMKAGLNILRLFSIFKFFVNFYLLHATRGEK